MESPRRSTLLTSPFDEQPHTGLVRTDYLDEADLKRLVMQIYEDIQLAPQGLQATLADRIHFVLFVLHDDALWARDLSVGVRADAILSIRLIASSNEPIPS